MKSCHFSQVSSRFFILQMIHHGMSFNSVTWNIMQVFKTSPLIEVQPEDVLPRIAPLAAVTCFNIVLGNVSLRYIPVSFVQTIKALTPATTGAFFVTFLTSVFFRLHFLPSFH